MPLEITWPYGGWVKFSLIHLIENDTSRAFKQLPISSRLSGLQLSAVQKSWTCSGLQRVSEVSLTVLQGERGAVHRLAFDSALWVGHRVGAVETAAKAGAQLKAPHVADHSCRIKGLLWRQGREANVAPKAWHVWFYCSTGYRILCVYY